MTNAQYAFELPITVREDDIDRLGHVNNVVYVRWVQEAATAHWRVLASEEERARLLWVVIRHEIDYKRPAMPGDTIVARTLWCPVDAKTLRPVEPGEQVRARFSTKSKDPLLPKEGRNGAPKLPAEKPSGQC